MEEAQEKEFAVFLMKKFPPGVRGTSGIYWHKYGKKITIIAHFLDAVLRKPPALSSIV